MQAILISISLFFFCSLSISGQVQSGFDAAGADSVTAMSAPVGTYQVLIPRKPAFALSEEFMAGVRIQAESSRKQSEDILFPITEHIYLRVPSKDAIQSPGFFQLEEIEYY